MGKRDPERDVRRHLAGERVDLGRALRGWPPTLDASLPTQAVMALLDRSPYGSTYTFGRTCKRVAACVARGVLAATGEGWQHLFLRLAVPLELDDAALEVAWQRAVQALLDLDLTYAWGSQARQRKLRALAADPLLLHAIQGTVAHSPQVRLDLLAVLVADGSAASFDALVPHLDPALLTRDARLERLVGLRIYAADTPALRGVFAEIETTLDARNATSPALALGPALGVGAVPVLWFAAMINSGGPVQPPRIQGHVTIDSRKARWFHVSISRVGAGLELESTAFDHAEQRGDALGIGRCEASGLPAWLAHAARHLGIRWTVSHVRSSLRGAARDRVAAWLVPP